nr:MAG TPA: hypothetical protein [Caudoviricetes sp.]
MLSEVICNTSDKYWKNPSASQMPDNIGVLKLSFLALS